MPPIPTTLAKVGLLLVAVLVLMSYCEASLHQTLSRPWALEGAPQREEGWVRSDETTATPRDAPHKPLVKSTEQQSLDSRDAILQRFCANDLNVFWLLFLLPSKAVAAPACWFDGLVVKWLGSDGPSPLCSYSLLCDEL